MATNTANRLATAARDAAAGPDPAPGAVIDASVLTAQLAFLAPGHSARFPWSRFPWARFPWGGPGGGRTVRASTSSTGGQSDGDSSYPALSANGRFVAFESDAANLAPNDSNRASDIFVKDLRTGRLTLASADAAGNGGNHGSSLPSISADGRFVAFDSAASNLAPGDANGFYDVFVKDLRTGQVTLASSDAQGNGGNSTSVSAAISGNGRFVAFASDATNLVPGGTGEDQNLFVKDLRTGTVTLASADAAGTEGNRASFGPSLSADGRFVAFTSWATNLAPNDANGTGDLFVKDLRTGRLTLVSVGVDGTQANDISVNPSLSADGRFVAFDSYATNLLPGGTESRQVFVKDLRTGRLTLASADAGGQAGDGRSIYAALSPNGRYVSFSSEASNLVPGDANNAEDMFRKDLWTGGISRLTNNAPADYPYGLGSEWSSVTNTGAVAFSGAAGNLVPNDTNGAHDIFVST